jgi:hypothetical protein
MPENDFWKIIERSKKGANADAANQREVLIKILRREDLKDIVRFNNMFQTMMNAANDTKLAAAVELLKGKCDDECFMHARAWLICQGKKTFMSVMSNPDELYSTNINAEKDFGTMQSCAADAYFAEQEMTLPYTLKLPNDIHGAQFVKNPENLKILFPQISSVIANR